MRVSGNEKDIQSKWGNWVVINAVFLAILVDAVANNLMFATVLIYAIVVGFMIVTFWVSSDKNADKYFTPHEYDWLPLPVDIGYDILIVGIMLSYEHYALSVLYAVSMFGHKIHYWRFMTRYTRDEHVQPE